MPSNNFQDVNSAVFPATARRGSSCGELKIQGIKASKLVQEYGSPLYVVDEPEFRERARRTRAAFVGAAEKAGTAASVYYASKSLLNVSVAKWIDEEGLSLDVSTGGEFAVALAANFPPARIGFHGNNKSLAEIERAARAGVHAIVIDSEQEVERIAEVAQRLGVRQNVRLRINSGVHAGGHEYLATSHEDQKFGLPLESAVRVAATIRSHDSLNFLGLHGHIGSQIHGVAGFQEAAKKLLSVYPELSESGPVPELNLGGGYGIAYTSQETAEAADISVFAEAIVSTVKDEADRLQIALPNLAFEPGRYISGPAGVTLYTVGTTKPVQLTEPETFLGESFTERLYVSVDGGMSDNARPALYGSQYEARLANRRSVAPAALARVVGKHCESGDVVVDRVLLPADVRPGDLLGVAATGAYCWSLSNNYNYVVRPPMVAVSNGQSRLIVRGQTEQELVEQSIF